MAAEQQGRDAQAMLRQADELRAAASGMDMQSAALSCASHIIGLERAARKQADKAIETARRKGQDAQERFVAGVRAQGMSLDEEIDVEANSQQNALVNLQGGNKYKVLMEKRKQIQQQEKGQT
eukprot:scaffold122376_cov32-Tisochrysis_lutea.AAC.1